MDGGGALHCRARPGLPPPRDRRMVRPVASRGAPVPCVFYHVR